MEQTEKELLQYKKRLKELANKSFQQGIYTFSEFMGLPEQDAFWQTEREERSLFAAAGFRLFGGREQADRVMARFGNPEELQYETEFPIACVYICPDSRKFADELTHRDFLGALMNLGIERSVLGDLVVGEKQAYLFCHQNMAAFICENLNKVKHTAVTARIAEQYEQLAQEEPVREMLQVSSPRADAVIAKVYRLSREESLQLFRGGRVYIDGRLCENNARTLKPGEQVNARGYGKFEFLGERGETRKGKQNVEAAVYR